MLQALPLSTPNRNLVRLTIVRGITWTGFLAAIIFGIEVLKFQLHVLPIISVIVAMGLCNVATWWRLGRPLAVTDTEYLLHWLVDIAGLSLLFYYTGGSTNPFITYLLVPLAIAASTLPWSYAWIIAFAATASYTFMMLFYEPVPQLASAELVSGIQLHTVGMWLNFILSGGLLSFFIFKMAHALRRRDLTLSRTREAALRNEQILAVATQAAGTAHELGTPLSTMAVLLNEMRHDAADQPQLLEDVELLRRQVDTCKQRLQTLVANADRRRLEKPETLRAIPWMESLIQRWLVLRPDVHHQLEIVGRRGQPWIAVDTTLEQALINLLNNAADASPEAVVTSLDWNVEELIIDIRDHGPGVPMSIADQLGDTFISTKSKGMGIGLFLSHATINRFGGGVSLYNHEEGGTLTEVKLPRVSAGEQP
ncbi:HAMP domain-containing histidine kinase [Salinicola endophyticus]|uniref:histidine kinase n=1 Tax=Salinicola endophyticus TaxID=1949083 RepID=A0ABY8FMR4_9GAMM|nr:MULTISPECIES: ATP-binding protein [Salinicola]WFF42968.1 HAMP domain-containing histidine kinase [Salinicola endophyticus]